MRARACALANAGEVIRGWELGVATMKKGEKATLTIKPKYAYGQEGAFLPPLTTGKLFRSSQKPPP